MPEELEVDVPSEVPTKRSGPALATVFCLIFALSRSEARILVQLLNRTHCTQGDVRAAAAARSDQNVTPGSAWAFICNLRRKLAAYDIRIATMPKFGYALDEPSRHRLRDILNQYDAGVAPKRPRAKPKAADELHAE
jgi:hypothetical protein